jgi:Ca2+-binding RTX toxin-like protein
MFSPTRDRCAAAAEAVRASAQRVIETLESRTMLDATLDGNVLRVEGTGGDDKIVVSAAGQNASQVLVRIGNGQPQRFRDANITRIRINGGGGDDNIKVTFTRGDLSQDVVINGGGGDDIIRGAGGDDVINGGDGNDILHGRKGDDTVDGGEGDDLVLGHSGGDVLNGGADDDIIYGLSGQDTLRGDGGNDTMGGDKEDRLNFLDPNLTSNQQGIKKQNGEDDVLDGGAGDDWLLGGIESDYDPRFTEGGEDPKPFDPGSNGQDTMTGGPGNDVIDARGRDDTITDKEAGDIVPIERYINHIPNPEEFEDDDYAFHDHFHMQILVDGENIEMPRGLSEFADVDNDRFPLLHKHWDPDNLEIQLHQIHIHSVDPTPIRGRDVFQGWGVSFSDRHIGQYRVKRGETITVSFNGNDMSITEFANQVVGDGDDIVVEFNTND